MVGLNCDHVYQYVGAEICPLCAQCTHEIDWVKQNELQAEWKKNNPEPKFGGWWSI